VIRILDELLVDSPYVEKITHGYTEKAGNIIRPADTNGHIVISKQFNKKEIYLVGPWSSATPLAYSADAEIIWSVSDLVRVYQQLRQSCIRIMNY
jgi:hypothetical protein